MAQMERKTVGFSVAEVAEIEQVIEAEEVAPLIGEVLVGGLGATSAGRSAVAPTTSFSEAVRKLTLVGLAQLQRTRRALQYREVAELEAEVADDEWVAAVGRSALAALDASLRRPGRAAAEASLPAEA